MEEPAEESFNGADPIINAPTKENDSFSIITTDSANLGTSSSSLDTSISDKSYSVSPSKEEQLEVFKKFRNNEDKSPLGRPSLWYLLPDEWRKSWFMYCIDKTGTVLPPGPIQTTDLLNSDWMNNSPDGENRSEGNIVYYKEPRMLPVRGDVKVIPVKEILWKHFVKWYGLAGPEVVRDSIDELGMHLMVISCIGISDNEGRSIRACVPKSISKLDFYEFLVEIFELPDTDSICKLEHFFQEDKGVLVVKVHLRPIRHFSPIDWSSAENLPLAGALGLPNIGNTCYMASALQALSQSKELTIPLLQDSSLQLGSISFEFCCLLKALWSGQRGDLSELKSSLAMKEYRFSSYAQQDSQELLAVLLDHINEELRTKRRAMSIETLHIGKDNLSQQEAWGNYLLKNNSIVTKVFGGLLKSTVKCGKCKTSSVTFDPFLFLSLPIPSGSAPKITLNIVGLGKKQIKASSGNFGQLEKDLGFECVFALVDLHGKFLQFIDPSDVLSDYTDDQPGDFFDFGKKKAKGSVFVYPKNTSIDGSFSLVSLCTKSSTYFLTGIDHIGFPLFVPYLQLSDVKECLREKLSMNMTDWEFKIIQQTGNSMVYSIRIQAEQSNSLKWIFDQLLPESCSASPTNSQDNVSLDDCLGAFEAEEILPSEVGWKCPHCKKPRAASKCLNLVQLPESSLMIHLKRFSFSAGATSNMGWFSGGSGRKVTTPISFPQYWRIRDDSNNDVFFELYAVIEHYGSLFGGHYTCAARNFLTGQWYRYDDSIVREIEIDSVLENSQGSSYVLFYERRVGKSGGK
jgi:ubiquitin C-terminal hydrolase